MADTELNKVSDIIDVVGSRQAIQEAWKVFRSLYDEEFQVFFDSCLESARQKSLGS